jgi:Ni,Fe-hydrogenase III small subunit
MAIRVFVLEGAGCGGCALEAQAAMTARYGSARRGIRLVEAPAHADVLLICGPLPAQLAEEVQRLESQLPQPWVRLQMGDCTAEEGPNAVLPGCPPAPQAIVAAIEEAWRRRPRKDKEGQT